RASNADQTPWRRFLFSRSSCRSRRLPSARGAAAHSRDVMGNRPSSCRSRSRPNKIHEDRSILPETTIVQLVQFFIPGRGRRVGILKSDRIVDLTGAGAGPTSVVELAGRAFQRGVRLATLVEELARAVQFDEWSYDRLLAAEPGGDVPWLLPPIDHP